MRIIAALFISLIALAGLPVHAAVLAKYEFENEMTSSDTEANSTAGSYSLGGGVSGFGYSTQRQSGDKSLYQANNGYYQTTETGAVTFNDYMYFGLTNAAGYAASLSNLSFYVRLNTDSSSSGPKHYALYTSADGFTFGNAVATGTLAVTDAFVQYSIDLSGVDTLQGVAAVELRLYLWRNDGEVVSTRQIRLDDIVLEGTTATPLASYDFLTGAASTNSVDSEPNSVAGAFSVGPGVGPFATSSLGGPVAKCVFFRNDSFNSTTESAAVSANDYLYFTLDVDAGYSASLSEFSFYTRFNNGLEGGYSSEGAPESYALYTSEDGFTLGNAIATGTMPEDGVFHQYTIDLSGVASLDGVTNTEFRLYLWTANGIQGTESRDFRIDTFELEGITYPTPTSAGVALRAYAASEGVYVEFIAYDVEADGSVMLALMDGDTVVWSDSVAVVAGPTYTARFLVPDLEIGQSYDFQLRDEVGQWWDVPGVTVQPFAAEMVAATLVGIELTFDSFPDHEYEIQWTTALGGLWQTVTNVMAFSEQTSVVIAYPDASGPGGFLRVVAK